MTKDLNIFEVAGRLAEMAAAEPVDTAELKGSFDEICGLCDLCCL